MGPLFSWLRSLLSGHQSISLTSAVNIYGNPLPIIPHAKITHFKRTIIIGDVHGCLEEVKELLIKSRYDSQTCDLIFVGDLVNKGKCWYMISYMLVHYIASDHCNCNNNRTIFGRGRSVCSKLECILCKRKSRRGCSTACSTAI